MADENIKKLELERKCNVPGCKSVKTAENLVHFFEIPKRVRCTPEIRNQWLTLLKLNRSRFPPNFHICEKHFEERDILRPVEVPENSKPWVTLLPKATPVHFLPDESTPKEEFVFDDNDDELDASSDDYPQSRDSLEKEVVPPPLTKEIAEEEPNLDTFHDAVENIEEKKANVETPSGMDDNIEEEEKVYHDLKPHITGEDEIPDFEPKITDFSKEPSKEPEEKVLKVVQMKRVAKPTNPEPIAEEDAADGESPVKRPRRNVIHKLIKPRNLQVSNESPIKTAPPKKDVTKPQVVIVKKIIKSPVKVEKKVVEKTPAKTVVQKPTEKVVEKTPAKPVKSIKISSKVEKEKLQSKIEKLQPKVVVKSIQKTIQKEPENENNGAAVSRSRRNVVHKLIKPRVEPASTPVSKVITPTVSKTIASVTKPSKVEIYSSTIVPEEKTPKKDDKSPKIVMISSRLIQGSPKFVKSPTAQILKLSPKNVVTAVQASPIVVTPKKSVIAKVAVKRLATKIHPIQEEDSSRPRRNVPHKFIKTTNNGASVEKEKKPSPPPQKLDPVESMHVALLKEFLSDSKSIQMEVVKKKATSIAKIIGLKSFKASDEWTKKFIAGNLGTCNGGN